jgi:hypothetical protein
VPTGAIKLKSVFVDEVCQKAAILIGGGDDITWAGVATDTEVSEYSRLGWYEDPIQSTEQVVDDPCDAGGLHISIWFTLTEPKKEVTVVFTTVHIVPALHIKELGVTAVEAELVETKR